MNNDINSLKIQDFINNPKDLILTQNITKDSWAFLTNDTFIIFTSYYNILNLIYATKSKSIIALNLNENQKIIEIKNSHNEYISQLKHIFLSKTKQDILMSVSGKNNNIKLWDINNWDCILNLKDVNQIGFFYATCFILDNNNYYIVTSNNCFNGDNEAIKIFDIKGNKIKDIDNSNENTLFIDVYYEDYDKYIITGNKGHIRSYNYNENKLYKEYVDKMEFNYVNLHTFLIIYYNDNTVKIIDSSMDGYIRIWDFHGGFLFSKINTYEKKIFSVCLWDENYLFVGCDENKMKLIHIKSKKIIMTYKNNSKYVLSIKKIKHKLYGDCLITQGFKDEQINLWINKNALELNNENNKNINYKNSNCINF